jgi:predicted phosphodiesterase
MHLLFAVLLLGHWLLASDLHVEPGPGAAAPAHYQQDTNWALLASTVAAMRKADPNPQLILLTGDFLAHQFPANPALAEKTMARIARTFNKAFPRTQFVIVPGNNDDPCGDYRATPGTPYFASIAHIWAPLVNRNGAAPRFEHDFGQYGWYASNVPAAHTRVLALDSVYWSIVYRSCANIHPNAPQRQLQWLAHSIDALPAHSRTVLAMHIPPGVDASSTMRTHWLLVVPFWQGRAANAFVRETQARSARIAFAVAGHMHRNDFRLFGGVPLLLAPAVSPIYKNNPSFLRLDVASDGTLRDYTGFYYDPSTQTWQAETSFDQAFGVSNFDAAALRSIHERLASDAELRHRWSDLFISNSRYVEIDSTTWRTYWCAQTGLEATFRTCAGVERRTLLLPIAGGVTVVVLAGLVALVIVRLRRGRRRA